MMSLGGAIEHFRLFFLNNKCTREALVYSIIRFFHGNQIKRRQQTTTYGTGYKFQNEHWLDKRFII